MVMRQLEPHCIKSVKPALIHCCRIIIQLCSCLVQFHSLDSVVLLSALVLLS